MGISNQNNALYWATGIDNSKLKGDADQTKKIFKDISGDVAKAGQAAIDQIKNQIDKTKDNIKSLESLVAQMRKKMEEAAPGNTKQNAIFDFNEASRSLKNQQSILDKLTSQRADLINTQKQQIGVNQAEENSIGNVVGLLGKWFVGLATVTTALKIFHSVVNSTKGTADQFEFAVSAMDNGVSYFWKTLATGDWSSFMTNMESAIITGYQYAKMMDDVKESSRALSIAEENSRGVVLKDTEALRNRELTKEQRLQAGKDIITEEERMAVLRKAVAKKEYDAAVLVATDRSKLSEKTLVAALSDIGTDAKEKAVAYNKANSEYQAALKIESKGIAGAVYGVIAEKDVKLLKKQLDDTPAAVKLYAAAFSGYSQLTEKMIDNTVKAIVKVQVAENSAMSGTQRARTMIHAVTAQMTAEEAAAAQKALDAKNAAIKAQLDYTTEIGKKRIANALEIEQQLLSAETDGAEKSRKQADLDYRKRISTLEIQKAEFIKKQNELSGGIDKKTGKPTATFSTVLPVEDQKQFDDMEAAALVVKNAKLTEITKTELDKLKSLYVKYGDERVKIEEEYNDRIKILVTARSLVEAMALTKERDEKISAVSERLIKETDLYKLASGKQLLISKALTQQLIAESKKQIAAEVAAHKLSPEDANKLLAKLDKADLTVQKTDNPFADLIDGVEKYKQAREEQSKTNAKDDIVGFAILEDSANKAQKATLEAAAGALQGISSIIRQVSNELTGLTDAEKKTVDEVTKAIDGAATLAMGIATDNPIAIAQGSIELLINVYKLADVESQKIEKRIEDDKAAVEKLAAAYDKLGIAISKAYSTDKSKLIANQTKNLEEQKKDIEDAIAAEQQKSINAKKLVGLWYYLAPKTDQKAIDEYNKQLDEINQKIEDNKTAQIEAITGTSVMSAIDEFANAYADAFTSGEDAALKSADIVKNILKKALVQDLSKDLKKPIDELTTMIADAMADGILTADEKALIELKKKEIDAIANKDKQMYTDLGLKDNKSGVTGQLQAQLTEGTGSQLVGLWNMTAMDTRIIKEWLLSRGNNGSTPVDISATVVSIQNDTHAISVNTLRTANNTDGLIDELQGIKTELKTELEEIKKNTKGDASRRV